ncbi:MAG: RNA 3'-terminal phosphate cyclase [Proteobacteria bacterium]|nr:RNA 3'-terminal phosphate cyclase [Pseudomonadota bacterium]MCP4915694.1 RNA 3'-terminal phosphate cyclase [Pseudomonadota bacterium]
MTTLQIDGSAGGGQILRSSLTLSLVTGKPFLITDIRGSRKKGGLLAQHLTCVRAAVEIGQAWIEGAHKHSKSLYFRPSSLDSGEYAWDVGAAGSATLVMQTVLPALLFGDNASRITVTGGTHNRSAPPFEFLDRCYGRALRELGQAAHFELGRRGFEPIGGGEVSASITPGEWVPYEVLERGRIKRIVAKAVVSELPRDIGQRELTVLKKELPDLRGEIVEETGPVGNVLLIQIDCPRPMLFTGFGRPGVRAQEVARQAVRPVKRWLDADVPIDEHLADQLVLLLALGAGGRFRTTKASDHLRTNVAVIRQFLPDVGIDIERRNKRVTEVRVTGTTS